MRRLIFLILAFSVSCSAAMAQRAYLAGIKGRVMVDADGAWMFLTLDASGGSRTIYISAAGPGLAASGISGVLADPRLEIWDANSALVAANDDRDGALLNDPNYSLFARSAKDAGVRLTLPPGQYSIHITGANGGTGVCLLQLNDPDVSPSISTIAVRARTENVSSTFKVQLYGVSRHDNISLAAFVTGPNLLVKDAMGDPMLRTGDAAAYSSTCSSWIGFMPITVGQSFRSPIINDSRNAGWAFLWSIGYDLKPNLPPEFEVGDELGIPNRQFLFELHNQDYATTRPAVAYVTSPDQTVSYGGPLKLIAITGGDVSRVIWQRNGVDIPGTGPSLIVLYNSVGFTVTFPSVTTADSGTYRLKMTSGTGAVSYSAPLTVKVQLGAPTITTQPHSMTVNSGAFAGLDVIASGGELKYQWSKNGVPITGATNATLSFTPATPDASGVYTVTVANSAGAVTSQPATLTVQAPATRLTNLSVRAQAGTGDRTLIVGFALEGSSKAMVLRAIGPSLAQFGVSGFVADPRMDIYDGGTLIMTNDNWTDNDGRTLGAFQLQSGTKDSVVSRTFAGRSYTAQIATVTGSPGEALVELYDGAADSLSARLVNLSTRTQVDAGQRLIVGMTLTGTAPKTVVLRAVGPTLTEFGVKGAHPDPMLELYDAKSQKIAENDQWSGDDGHSAGAFSLAIGSKDAVLVRSLPPGSFTVHVLGVGGTSGVVLVELYEMR